jgi:hypothetical protein
MFAVGTDGPILEVYNSQKLAKLAVTYPYEEADAPLSFLIIS